MKHGRLPWPKPDELDESQRAVYDKIVGGPRASGPAAFQLTDPEGRLEGPFNAMLVNPPVGDALQKLGAAIRYRTGLSARAREIAILVLAQARQSDFEWYAHARVGLLAGLTAEEIDELAQGRTASTFSHAELIVAAVVRALLESRDLDDDLSARASELLGQSNLYDLVVLVGYYDLLALSMQVWRTPLPAGEAPVFDGIRT